MTEKKFWRDLNRLSYQGAEGVPEAARLLRAAYENNLGVLCGCMRTRPDMVNQLFIYMDDSKPYLPNNRYMLCYTSKEMAAGDEILPDGYGALPLRFVIDNALNKPVIGGLIFNHYVRDRMMVIPKQLLGDRPKYFTEIEQTLTEPLRPLVWRKGGG